MIKKMFAVLFGIGVSGILLCVLPCFVMAQDDDGRADEDELAFYELEEQFMVTATKRKIAVRKAPAIATVVTADEIRNMGARNLMDVLKMVPGFGVSINEFGRHMFEVRGIRTSTSEKILVMLDGHRLNESYTGSALSIMFDDLPVENAKQIEIVRGPGSALYGANAFVAVVNIITKDADDIEGVETTVTGGSFDTKKISLLAGKSSDDLKVFGSINYIDTEGPKVTIEADRLSGTPFSTTPGDTDSHLKKTDIFLEASYGSLTFRGHFADKDRGSYIGWARALTDDNIYEHKNYWTELEYARSFTDSLSTKVRIYYDYFEQYTMLEPFPEGFAGFPDGVIGSPRFKNRNYGAEFQFDMNLFKGNHLIAGVCFDDIKQFDLIIRLIEADFC